MFQEGIGIVGYVLKRASEGAGANQYKSDLCCISPQPALVV